MRPSPAVVIALVALVAALTGVGVAAIPGPDGTIQACYAEEGGDLRIVDGVSECSEDERPLAWSQRSGSSSGSASASTAPSQPASGRYRLRLRTATIDLESVSGCGTRLEVDEQSAGGDRTATLSVGHRVAERCVATMIGLPAAVSEWRRDTAVGGDWRRDVQIERIDNRGAVLQTLEAQDAFVTRLRIDAWAHPSGDPLRVLLEFQPNRIEQNPVTRARAAVEATPNISPAHPVRIDLALDGVNAPRPDAVSQIEMVTPAEDATSGLDVAWKQFRPGAAAPVRIHARWPAVAGMTGGPDLSALQSLANAFAQGRSPILGTVRLLDAQDNLRRTISLREVIAITGLDPFPEADGLRGMTFQVGAALPQG